MQNVKNKGTQKIRPFLWFDGKAEEAAKFYTSIFKNSKIRSISQMSATFQLDGLEFIALNGGPQFKFSPATSFFVECETHGEVDEVWKKLSKGGTVLMELAAYPFSEKFGWVQDEFAVSWQLNLAGRRQTMTPFLMFVGEQYGKADEAMSFYISLFKNSSVTRIERYGAGEAEAEGTVKHARFALNGQQFMAMDSGREHPFTFTPAISFFVSCDTQEEINYFWEKLSAGGQIIECGWLKDKFGMAWQIVPDVLLDWIQDDDPPRKDRVMKAMMKMKKLDIAELQQAAAAQ